MHCRLIELCCVRQRSRLDTVPVANSLYMHLSTPHTGHVTHMGHMDQDGKKVDEMSLFF